jgi:hypothetical protein
MPRYPWMKGRHDVDEVAPQPKANGDRHSPMESDSRRRAWRWLIIIQLLGLLFATNMFVLYGLPLLPLAFISAALSGRLSWDTVSSSLKEIVTASKEYGFYAAVTSGDYRRLEYWLGVLSFDLPFSLFGIWVFWRLRQDQRKGKLSATKIVLGIFVALLIFSALVMFGLSGV